ncbi:IclR family transcriptional regulator [Mesorhizobium comanense]|uniref:IclR family transcriptional regulator n=1 Tax=Mesorhizobium comanense TaxID=2502215 RepID=UPI0010F4B500|nr:IclR family transcriptional regulator C-terminal domain-containing protein [Mesorhizobium comanense]
MAGAARGIQSIEVSGRILRALVEVCEPMMLKDLAAAADLVPAQCHAYLTSMRHVGLVHQEMDTGLYRMGPFAMALGIGWLRSSPVPSAALRTLGALTDELGYMSVIAVWGQFGPTIVHVNDGLWPSALNIRQGTLFSITGTATGRVFAAFGNADDIEDQITSELRGAAGGRSLGPAQAREDFEAQVQLARKVGYSTAIGAPVPGINAVAAPIFGKDGEFTLVATVIGPSGEMPVDDDSPAVQKLFAAARSISEGLVETEKSYPARTRQFSGVGTG